MWGSEHGDSGRGDGLWVGKNCPQGQDPYPCLPGTEGFPGVSMLLGRWEWSEL